MSIVNDLNNLENVIEKSEAIDLWITKIKNNHTTGQSLSGNDKCPVCRAIINYTIHINGHLYAKCQDPGCITILE